MVGGGLSLARNKHPLHSPQAQLSVLEPQPPRQLQQQQNHIFYGSSAGGAAKTKGKPRVSSLLVLSALPVAPCGLELRLWLMHR